MVVVVGVVVVLFPSGEEIFGSRDDSFESVCGCLWLL